MSPGRQRIQLITLSEGSRLRATRWAVGVTHYLFTLLVEALVGLLIRGVSAVPTDLLPVRIFRIQAQRADDVGLADEVMALVRQEITAIGF